MSRRSSDLILVFDNITKVQSLPGPLGNNKLLFPENRKIVSLTGFLRDRSLKWFVNDNDISRCTCNGGRNSALFPSVCNVAAQRILAGNGFVVRCHVISEWPMRACTIGYWENPSYMLKVRSCSIRTSHFWLVGSGFSFVGLVLSEREKIWFVWLINFFNRHQTRPKRFKTNG